MTISLIQEVFLFFATFTLIVYKVFPVLLKKVEISCIFTFCISVPLYPLIKSRCTNQPEIGSICFKVLAHFRINLILLGVK
uniref:Uncharacterized protein n=1 Tax=Borreliella burgdorferi TaxID=139 RepID=Q9ZIY6_BORBG|nr:unknown [Borreliella burgdorferi N40]